MARSSESRDFRITPLESFPPVERWDDWTEPDPAHWPRRVDRRFSLVPTTCFNCEAACGLMAYVDKDTGRIEKFEGNPHHPGSRGRNCAKGPATLNQVEDPHRILYPLKRSGPRGSGQFQRTTWDEVLDTFASRIRKAIVEKRLTEVMYHVGRPGEDGFTTRVLQSWGIDGHNSHTNVCSAAARLGYALWSGSDRPSPDHANAKFILLLSAHLETGHYFNPHAQRIIEGRAHGAKVCVVDIRHSNTASKADHWLAPWPGTEALLLLSFAHVILEEGLFDDGFIRRWVDWRTYLTETRPGTEPVFDRFIEALREDYAFAAPESVAEECDVDAATIRQIGREIGEAGSRFASHVWRNAASGNLGGWQVARCLQFLSVLVGAVGSKGGTNLHSTNKFVPPPFSKPDHQSCWNELLYPREYPLSHHELSYLLPHFLLDGRGSIDVYFTRVYNPVWTNPDGMMWERVLRDESLIGLHAAMTPVWSETAQYADYVLPMGNGAERHDLVSQETHAGAWISFRQPVLRVARERAGESFSATHEANPGEVWEEAEFWIELSWRIDPDGSLGIRRHFESPDRPGQKITVEEHYAWIFEHTVPGLPEAAGALRLTPLQYMRRFGAFEVQRDAYASHLRPLPDADAPDVQMRDDGVVVRGGTPAGVIDENATARVGFETPSRQLEVYSRTMAEWRWPEHATPGYIRSHVHRDGLDRERGEMVLVPTFRLPTLIHTRSANSKWLSELSNSNPVWIHPDDAARVGVATGELLRVATEIGYFVNRAWVTQSIRPGVVACSHHLGRWRLRDEDGVHRWASARVERAEVEPGKYLLRRVENPGAYESTDPDTRRIWWSDGGVHQNLVFPVQPDPVSGMHCWHQKVTVCVAHDGDRYADVYVDTNASMEVYRRWLAGTRAAPGPGGLRRPEWFARVVRPTPDAYRIES